MEDIEEVPALLKAAASSSPMKASTESMPVEMGSPSKDSVDHGVVSKFPTPKVEASEPLRPSLRRRFRDAQLEEARNPTPMILTREGVDDFFNAAMLPDFVGMQPSFSNLRCPFSIFTRQLSPVVPAPIPVVSPSKAGSAYVSSPVTSPVVLTPVPVMTQTEPAPEPKIIELYGPALPQIDSSFSDTESDTEMELFSAPLPEIDSLFSDDEDEAEIKITISKLNAKVFPHVAKKAKKAKVQADTTDLITADEAAAMVSAEEDVSAPKPTLFENFKTEVDMQGVKTLSATCAIGGFSFLVGCAVVGAACAAFFRGIKN